MADYELKPCPFCGSVAELCGGDTETGAVVCQCDGKVVDGDQVNPAAGPGADEIMAALQP